MHTDVQTVSTLFQGARHYYIPNYQRRYVWTQTEWRRLWEDLQRAAQASDSPSPFIGAVILRKETPGILDVFEVIDGQQRLITFQVILAALDRLYSRYNETDTSHYSRPIKALLQNRDLLSPHAPDPHRRFKLWPSSVSDRHVFTRVIAPADAIALNSEPHPIGEAYYFFRHYIGDHICQEGPTHALSRLDNFSSVFAHKVRVAKVTVEDDDNTNTAVLFQSLNAIGKRLAQFDYLRNNLFLRAGSDGATLYDNYWKDFDTNDYWDDGGRLDRFLRLYLESHLGPRVAEIKASELIDVYEHDLRPELGPIEKEFAELHCYAQAYEAAQNNRPHNDESRRQIQRLIQERAQFLKAFPKDEAAPLAPLLLMINAYLVDRKWDEHTDTEHKGMLFCIEAYMVRRYLCEEQPVSRRLMGFLANVVLTDRRFDCASLRRWLLSSKEEQWPDDLRVQEGLKAIGRDGQAAPLVFVLGRIEELKRSTPAYRLAGVGVDADGDVRTDGLTREHIQSQSTGRACVNSIGNLTLASAELQSRLGNQDVAAKVPIFSGAGSLMLNREVVEYYGHGKCWDDDVISKREQELGNIILSEWSVDHDEERDGLEAWQWDTVEWQVKQVKYPGVMGLANVTDHGERIHGQTATKKPTQVRLEKEELEWARVSADSTLVEGWHQQMAKDPNQWGFVETNRTPQRRLRIWDSMIETAKTKGCEVGVQTKSEKYIWGNIRRYNDQQIELHRERTVTIVFRKCELLQFVSNVWYQGYVLEWDGKQGLLRSTSNRREVWQRVRMSAQDRMPAGVTELHTGYRVKFRVRAVFVSGQVVLEAHEVKVVSAEYPDAS